MFTRQKRTAPEDCIRWMLNRDLDQIVHIENQTFDVPYSRAEIENLARQRDSVVLVSDRQWPDGSARVHGYMAYMFCYNAAYIVRMAVDPNQRSNGVGTRLVNQLKRLVSISRKRDRIVLSVLLMDWRVAEFLSRNGFVADAQCEDDIGRDWLHFTWRDAWE